MDEIAQYLTVTPLGALHATKQAEDESVRQTLTNLLRMKESPLLNDELMMLLTGEENIQAAQKIMYELQTQHYIQVEKIPVKLPELNIEKEMPAILRLLSSSGKVLLVDTHGFLISYSGFDEESVDGLSILSSQFTNIYQQYGGFISQQSSSKYTSVGIISNQGISCMGFFVLDIAGTVFTLTISDTPFLNQRSFRDIVWLLTYRYS